MNALLEEFLQDTAQGVFGDSKDLNYGETFKYADKATKKDLKKLNNFMLDFFESDGEPEQSELDKLVEHIREVNKRAE